MGRTNPSRRSCSCARLLLYGLFHCFSPEGTRDKRDAGLAIAVAANVTNALSTPSLNRLRAPPTEQARSSPKVGPASCRLQERLQATQPAGNPVPTREI
jgi:hypothetical protein